MQSLGFENYAEALKIYLIKYRETTKIDRGPAKEKDDEGTEPSLFNAQGEHTGQPVPLPAGSMPPNNFYNPMAGNPYMDPKN